MTLKRLALLLSMVLILVLVASYWLIRMLVIIPILEREVASLQWHETLAVRQYFSQQQMLLSDLAISPGYDHWAKSVLEGGDATSRLTRGAEVAMAFGPDLSLRSFLAHDSREPDHFPILVGEAAYQRARLMPTMLPEREMVKTGLLWLGGNLYSYSASTVCSLNKLGCTLGYLLLLKPMPVSEVESNFTRLGIRVTARPARSEDLALPRLMNLTGLDEPVRQRDLLIRDSLSQGAWVLSIVYSAQVQHGVERREWIAFVLLLLLLPTTNFLLWRIFVTPIEFGSDQLLQMERERQYRKLTVNMYVKEFQHLVNAFNGLIGRVEKQRQQLQDLSQTDSLTGLANRRGMDHFAVREWRRLCRARYGGAVMMLDIDDFKAYNDEFGHQAGDDCLVCVARELKRVARRGEDIACRYGGEEFCTIYVEVQPETVEKLAESLRRHIEKLHKSTALLKRPISASIGVALVEPGVDLVKQFHDFDQLVRIADQQLYLAKQNGKNQVRMWRLSTAATEKPA
ncbi:GGDEF domain-containing protein [Ferrimonas sediminicola]|uniref:diguanylate cyclase n=1 Tax=Ferrimonas sediminicola TaxID=2569538 RepID=A0A4U1BCG9_9GAMM|nr:GGDEF domain-containing protein [Ferrimonas sediminicola]TKB48713.1 GGDEF domain-containing protein [Ferrimonas sediminicola]